MHNNQILKESKKTHRHDAFFILVIQQQQFLLQPLIYLCKNRIHRIQCEKRAMLRNLGKVPK